MLLSLRNDHKEHLMLLTDHSINVDFCKLAVDFLQNGPNLKLYSTAAQKLEVHPENIQNCVYGLVNLLIESCKHKLSEADFRDSVLTVGFSQGQQQVLSKFYESKQNIIADILKNCAVQEPHYFNLEWRFEVQVASRTLLQQATPIVTMDLALKTPNADLSEEDTEKHLLLQTDVSNLVRLTEELELALSESRSPHFRKIQRAFKN